MSKREAPHGTVNERFMRHNYRASGFVPKEPADVLTQREWAIAEFAYKCAESGDNIQNMFDKLRAMLNK